MRRRQRGFTLIEVILALSLVGALLVITFGGLRVGLAAWRQGDERAEVQQHARSVVQVISRALAGVHPYLQTPAPGEQGGLLFDGDSERVAFVTVAPPFPAAAPIAFTAVTLSHEAGSQPGLVIRQKVLPNRGAFERVSPTLADPAVTALRFRYLRESTGGWEDRWDARREKALPSAVQITLTMRLNGRTVEHPPLTLAIRAVAP